MSTVMALGDVVTVRLNYRDDQGSVMFNVLHYTLAEATPVGSGTPPFTSVEADLAMPALAAVAANTIGAEWALAAAAGCRLEGATAQSIYPLPLSRQYNYSPTEPYVGEVAGDMLPSQDAVTLLKRTPFGGRSGIGRIYLPGIPESFQASGELTEDAAQAYINVASTFEQRLLTTVGNYGLQFQPVLYRQTTGGTAFLQTITAVELSDRFIKTQRRRRPGKGI